MVKEITGQELQQWMDEGLEFQLIDVRTMREHTAGHLASDVHIPVGDILQATEQIATDKKVVFYCRSGIRSYEAVRIVQEEMEHEHLYNLKRGILSWRGTIIR